MDLSSILLVSFLAAFFIIWRMVSTPKGTLQRAVLGACFPFVLAMGGTCMVMTMISGDVVTGSLSYASIKALRQWEVELPDHIKLAGDLAPPWALISFALLALVAAAAKVKVKALTAARKLALLMQFACACLGAASFFTLFGDGLEDRLNDVRSEIHVAQVRLHALKDELIRKIAAATAKEAIAMVRANPQPVVVALRNDVALAQQHAETLKKLGPDRQKVGVFVLSRAPWITETPLNERRKIAAQSEVPAAYWSVADADIMPRHSGRALFERSDPAVDVAAKEDVAKEFMGQVFSAAKDAFIKDPVEAFVFDLLASSAAELVKSALNRGLFSPILDRAWSSLAKGEDPVATAHDGIKAALNPLDAERPWRAEAVQAALALDVRQSRWVADHMMSTDIKASQLAREDLRNSIRWAIAGLGSPASANLLGLAEQKAMQRMAKPEQYEAALFDEPALEVARLYDTAPLVALGLLRSESGATLPLWDSARGTQILGRVIRESERKAEEQWRSRDIRPPKPPKPRKGFGR